MKPLQLLGPIALLLLVACSVSTSTTVTPVSVATTSTSKETRPVLGKAPQVDPTVWRNTPEAVSLESKPAVVEFWGTWCGPCKRAMPHLASTYETYKDQGLAMVGVHVKKGLNLTDVDQFIEGYKVPYPVACDGTGRIARDFGVGPIPRAFVINHEGDIIWEGNPLSNPNEFDDAVAHVVKRASSR